MRVISNRALVEFSRRNPAAGRPLQAWRKIAERNAFADFADLKRQFNSVDRVGDYYVFDIGGNKYRLIAAIHFAGQRLYVRHVLTHAEYDDWEP